MLWDWARVSIPKERLVAAMPIQAAARGNSGNKARLSTSALLIVL